jgi:hypothetical protein
MVSYSVTHFPVCTHHHTHSHAVSLASSPRGWPSFTALCHWLPYSPMDIPGLFPCQGVHNDCPSAWTTPVWIAGCFCQDFVQMWALSEPTPSVLFKIAACPIPIAFSSPCPGGTRDKCPIAFVTFRHILYDLLVFWFCLLTVYLHWNESSKKVGPLFCSILFNL